MQLLVLLIFGLLVNFAYCGVISFLVMFGWNGFMNEVLGFASVTWGQAFCGCVLLWCVSGLTKGVEVNATKK